MNNTRYWNAKNIKAELDDYVIGQEKGTRSIAMAIAQHLQQRDYHGPRELLQTDNVLLIGPTGCGKTETFRVMHKLQFEFDCPVVMFNALDYSATKSWQGNAITDIFDDVAEEALKIYRYKYSKVRESVDMIKRKVTEIANRAIILLDEFDKIAMHGENCSRSFVKEYQSNLLKLVEGNTYEVNDTIGYKRKYQKHNDNGSEETETETVYLDNLKLNTKHMMFIFIGAFQGISDITKYRLSEEKNSKKKTSASIDYQGTHIGFMTSTRKNIVIKQEEYTYEQLIPSQDDIIKYGLMRELVGRITIRTVYLPLAEDALVDILIRSKTSAYKKYQERFKQNGHVLRCSRSALREIAHICVDRGTGARGLMNVFAEILQETQYELSDNPRPIHCLVIGKDVREHKPPLLHDITEKANRKWKKRLKKMYEEQHNK